MYITLISPVITPLVLLIRQLCPHQAIPSCFNCIIYLIFLNVHSFHHIPLYTLQPTYPRFPHPHPQNLPTTPWLMVSHVFSYSRKCTVLTLNDIYSLSERDFGHCPVVCQWRLWMFLTEVDCCFFLRFSLIRSHPNHLPSITSLTF